MRFKVKENTFLTTDSSQSCYGLPVLQIGGSVYRPADQINGRTAADLVASWATQKNRTENQTSLAWAFLQQWPDGPQIEKITKIPFRALVNRDTHLAFKKRCLDLGKSMNQIIEGFMETFIKNENTPK